MPLSHLAFAHSMVPVVPTLPLCSEGPTWTLEEPMGMGVAGPLTSVFAFCVILYKTLEAGDAGVRAVASFWYDPPQVSPLVITVYTGSASLLT